MDEIAQIEQAHRELARRDGNAMWHARNWRRLAFTLLTGLMASVAVIIYQARQTAQVHAFVQTVQMTEEGRLVQVGMPMDLLAYEPQEGEWLTMLYQWVRLYRWRSEDSVRTKLDWDWLKQHTCGAASKELLRDEIALDPYKTTKRNSVQISTITKTRTPASYQVLWEEIRADKGLSKEEKVSHTGTFTVARVRPKTMTLLMQNRLGLCVNGYASDPQVRY